MAAFYLMMYNLSFKEMLTKEQPESSAAFYLNGSCSKLLECLNEQWTEAPSTIVTSLFCQKNVLNWCFCFQNQVIPLCILGKLQYLVVLQIYIKYVGD